MNLAEKSYIRKILNNNLRLDLRDFSQSRNLSIKDSFNQQANKSIIITNNDSEIELGILFKILNDDNYLMINNNFFIDNNHFIIKNIIKILEIFNLTAIIEINIIKDKGNLYDLFFRGLNHIFKDIKIPNCINLNNKYFINNNIIKLNYKDINKDLFLSKLDLNSIEFNINLELPLSETYCIFNNKLIKDPLKEEELSLDGILHVFYYNNNKLKVIIENNIKKNNKEEYFNILNKI